MRTNQTIQDTQSELTLKGLLEKNYTSPAPLSNMQSNMQPDIAYHEMDMVPVREVNGLAQLSNNVEMLSSLRSKLQFMNREIRYLMKL